MTTVVALPNCGNEIARTPNEYLISRLEEILAEARSGHLQNFIGVGMCVDGWSTNVAAGDLGFKSTQLVGALTIQHHRLVSDRVKS